MTRFNSDIEFIHSSGQISCASGDLTLRPDSSETRSVIIGSGANLRPERDLTDELGTTFARWYGLRAGRIDALSGILGGPTQTFTILQNGFAFNSATVTITAGQLDLISSSVFNLEGASEFNSDGIVRFANISQFEMDTLMRPSIDNLGEIGQTTRRFARIHGTSGLFNQLSPHVSGTHIQIDGSLSPSEDAQYLLGGGAGSDVGGDPARWSDVIAVSGHFNAIYPQVSGTGIGGNPDVWMELGGSLIPSLDNDALFWLGVGKNNRFAGIEAVSGVFTDISATTADVTTADIRTLNFDNNGDIVNTGILDWDLGASTTTISNGTWAFDSDVDVEFDKRPTTLSSGMAMQAENYFEVYAGRNVLIANPVTSLDLYVTNDGAAITPGDYFFTVSEDVQLRHYTVETVHLDSNPAPWAIRLRIEGRDNDHASGLFNWGAASSTEFTYRGSLSGTQTIPGGSRCRIRVDADGAAGHNTAFAKVWLGMTVVSGLRGGLD